MVRAIQEWHVRSIIIWAIFVCVLSILAVPRNADAATTTILYQSDFLTDPGWITDQPQNFYWSSTTGALFAHTQNIPTTTATTTRYFYTETNLNPRLSYELAYDIQITAVGGSNGGSGVAPFGLYGKNLYGFNQLNLNFQGNIQDGTFSTRFMQIDGSANAIFTEVNPGFNHNIGGGNIHPFQKNVWYTVTEYYDARSLEYRFSVRIRGETNPVFQKTITASSTDIVNPELRRLGISMHPEGVGLTNLSYGARGDGYAEYLIDNVSLTQIFDETYTAPSSVLFLPGIQASRLYTDGILGENQLWEPNRNHDVELLSMSEEGISAEDVYTRDVMGSIFGFSPVYAGMLSYLETLKNTGKISAWESFPYDWRYSVRDVVEQGAAYEEGIRYPAAVLEALARRNNSHVTIVAHSNGGLLAKALMDKLVRDGKGYLVDRIIFVASPQLGTPKAIGSILHGYDQEQLAGLLVDDGVARETLRNMPGAYGLVPSDRYFSMVPGPVISFDTSSTTELFRTAYQEDIADGSELISFMTGSGDGRPQPVDTHDAGFANANMLATARAYHRDMLDTWTAPAHVEVAEIVGVGLSTIRAFAYRELKQMTCTTLGGCTRVPYYEALPVFTPYGDGTVIASSARAYPGNKTTYYVDLAEVKKTDNALGVSHADITELSAVQEIIRALIGRVSVAIPFVYATPRTFTDAYDVVSVHSPVTLTLADSIGRTVEKMGSGTTTRIVHTIPGSAYFEFGESKYVVVPSAADYTVALEAVREGSFSVRVERGVGGVSTVLSEISAATATAGTRITFSKQAGIFSDVSFDYDGDGVSDHMVTVNGERTTKELYTELRLRIGDLTGIKAQEVSWLLNATDRAERAGERKGDGSANVAHIFEQMTGRLETYVAAGTVSSAAYNEIETIMNKIKTR